MFALVFSGVAIAGLLGWLILIKRREARAERRISRTPGPSPVVVDRPYDPTLCDFCDEKRVAACLACTRPLCALHAPWRPEMFCASCNDEWDAGARRRALIIVPVVLLAMMTIAGAVAAIAAATSMRPNLGLLVVWLGSGAPIYLAIERWMRRLFRRRGQLARARLRR